ncbi:integrase catalytic subunit (plasmid) [Mycobacterium intracellulare subsp. chimaera]|uniref:Integrase catalytic subunit n=1 Tax=Mycobacterium intracellulare subsp. chimaera TaxID=222805 RepID=A0A7U5MRI4_MYCIT|nr:integrase catalytic subunit [Mycobacterium intracellulare subsp. chimaera]
MPIAPRTFHAWATRAPSKQALWDATIIEILAGYYEPHQHGWRKSESLYGSLKMLTVEIGDWSRFTGSSIGAYVLLVPCE